MLRSSFITSRLHLSKFAQILLSVLVFSSLLIGIVQYAHPVTFGFGIGGKLPAIIDYGHHTEESPIPSTESTPEGNATLLALAPPYVYSVMNPQNNSFDMLECPAINEERYRPLQVSSAVSPAEPPKYFFAMDLYQNAAAIPRLLSSVVEVIKFLGPASCTLSMVVGISPDGTYEILKLLQPEVEALGATYHLVSSSLDSHAGNRIEILAKLRNLALEPLFPNADDPNITVIFLNDVFICAEDILELIHQRKFQNADQVCAMDWAYVGVDPTFYDVWVARGMNGDTFFEIPPDGNWNSAWNLFWNNPVSQEKWRSNKPFQVFTCWNGATVFTSKILTKVRFRHAGEGECFQGEPSLFNKDMWNNGFGRIAVVPSVNLEYRDDYTKKLKKLKGYVSEIVPQVEGPENIEWEPEPPELVKCIPSYEGQYWVPWNEGL